MAEFLNGALNGLSESAKEKAALEVRKFVNKQVKKEIAKRKKKFARKLVMTGIVFAVGCVLYVSSDKIVDLLSDRLLSGKGGKKRSKGGKSAGRKQNVRLKGKIRR